MGGVAEENLFDVTSGRNVHRRGDVLNFMLYLDTYHGLHYLIYHLEYMVVASGGQTKRTFTLNKITDSLDFTMIGKHLG